MLVVLSKLHRCHRARVTYAFSPCPASPRRLIHVLCVRVPPFVPYTLFHLGPYTACHHPTPCTLYHVRYTTLYLVWCATMHRVPYTVHRVPPCIVYQLFWSLLKIQSPPQLEVVLRHIRIVTERYSQLDRWRYPQPPVKVRVHAPAGATSSLHFFCFCVLPLSLFSLFLLFIVTFLVLFLLVF